METEAQPDQDLIGPLPVGTMVMYRPTADDPSHNGAEVLPAVIVRSWEPEKANLKVLNDGTEDFWKTSAERGTGDGQWLRVV